MITRLSLNLLSIDHGQAFLTPPLSGVFVVSDIPDLFRSALSLSLSFSHFFYILVWFSLVHSQLLFFIALEQFLFFISPSLLLFSFFVFHILSYHLNSYFGYLFIYIDKSVEPSSFSHLIHYLHLHQIITLIDHLQVRLIFISFPIYLYIYTIRPNRL